MNLTRPFTRAAVGSRPAPGQRAAVFTARTETFDRATRLREATPAPWAVVISAMSVAVWLASALYIWHFGRTWHLDLRVYRAAARTLLDHGTPFRSSFTADHLLFTYPPFALLVLTPLSLGPLGLVEGAWWTLSSIALVGTLYLLVPCEIGGRSPSVSRRVAIAFLLGGTATLVLEPVRSNMDYGQINVLLMFLVALDICRSHSKWSGVAIGLATAVKLTPIVYLLFFAVRRDWRSVGRGVAGFVAATLLAWVALPDDSALYWFHEVTDVARTGSVGFVSNQSLYGVLHRAPFLDNGAVTFEWVTGCACVTALGALLAYKLQSRRRPAAESVLALALVEGLISPISWTHHWSWMATAPLAVTTLWPKFRGVVAALVVTFGVAVVTPYWWGLRSGAGAFLANNSLALAGFCVLLAFTAAQLGRPRNATTAVTDRNGWRWTHAPRTNQP